MQKKDPAAVSLGQRRMATMTKKERVQFAHMGVAARMAKLTPEERSAIARKAGRTRKRKRSKPKGDEL